LIGLLVLDHQLIVWSNWKSSSGCGTGSDSNGNPASSSLPGGPRAGQSSGDWCSHPISMTASSLPTLGGWGPSGSCRLDTGRSPQKYLKSAGFRFFRNRNLSQSTLKIPKGFAMGRSETSADTAVGARQRSSALHENQNLDCSRTRVICQLGPFAGAPKPVGPFS